MIRPFGSLGKTLTSHFAVYDNGNGGRLSSSRDCCRESAKHCFLAKGWGGILRAHDSVQRSTDGVDFRSRRKNLTEMNEVGNFYLMRLQLLERWTQVGMEPTGLRVLG